MPISESEYVKTVEGLQNRIAELETRAKVSEAARHGLKQALRRGSIKKKHSPGPTKKEADNGFLSWLVSD